VVQFFNAKPGRVAVNGCVGVYVCNSMTTSLCSYRNMVVHDLSMFTQL